MPTLHIVQGGISNGDKEWIDEAAKNGRDAKMWIVPKGAVPDDDVVIYIGRYGFYCTAKIKSLPKPRVGWPGRYGAGLTAIDLIVPAVSLGTICRRIPSLTWANYPRSITTPNATVSAQIRRLIHNRRSTGIPDFDDQSLYSSNIDELRKVALLAEKRAATAKERKVIVRARSLAIKLYVLLRANGVCEGCNYPAPFLKPDGSPYLEPHHTQRLADDGPDHPAHVIALCPNCHRRAHHSKDAATFNASLIKALRRIEPDP